jgi:hypothetical protein
MSKELVFVDPLSLDEVVGGKEPAVSDKAPFFAGFWGLGKESSDMERVFVRFLDSGMEHSEFVLADVSGLGKDSGKARHSHMPGWNLFLDWGKEGSDKEPALAGLLKLGLSGLGTEDLGTEDWGEELFFADFLD